MRTLVIGIPLPHVSFDNYSFVSAPSLSEYRRLVIETEAVSRAVEAVITGSSEHATFAGQPVVNGPASSRQFGLGELLHMRRTGAEHFFAARSVAVCIAYPDASHSGIVGLPSGAGTSGFQSRPVSATGAICSRALGDPAPH